eukprot:632815-Rhodomonas_salina.2
MNIGGIYTDPLHAPTTASANIYNIPGPWFGGLRFISWKKEEPEPFVCIGCDDGVHWWTLSGKFSDVSTGAIDMDFTPKAPGVGFLKCKYVPGALSFLDGDKIANTWSRLTANSGVALEPQTKHAAFNDFNGLYVDPAIFKAGSFAGIRVVSDRLGKIMRDELSVVGSDDGESFWGLEEGKITNKQAGQFQIGSLTGTCHNGLIKFGDGTEWVKMAAKCDFHALPKEKAPKL